MVDNKITNKDIITYERADFEAFQKKLDDEEITYLYHEIEGRTVSLQFNNQTVLDADY